jgi:N-acetyl-gamma-glutamyl-phosphate/LysW-gamma-L-alpha-aminoadipyl-6-phosphate reductase
MKKISVSIVGGSGYAGGEMLRLLISHPNFEVKQVTSRKYAKFPITLNHPNLRGFTDLKYTKLEDLEKVDCLILALPHGESQKNIEHYKSIGTKIVDLASDFRIKDLEKYTRWYGEHTSPENVENFVYGIPELNLENIQNANYVACAGCEATCASLSLYPLAKEGILEPDVVVDSKIGSSTAGNKPSESSHHAERSRTVRTTKPTGHRHTAEIEMNTGLNISMTETSIELVRGILTTAHAKLKQNNLKDVDIWRIYDKYYSDKFFIRLLKNRMGLYRFPEPKILQGTNFCDISFEIDKHSNRLVILSAIDNLMKGTAGQALQCMNLMYGFEENTGLMFTGLHPV